MTTIQTNLTDDEIVEIAQTIDKCLMEVGEKFKPSGIEVASITLGRLMVLCNQLECYGTFHQLMEQVVKMGAIDAPSEDLNAKNEDGGTEQQGSVS